MKPNISKKYRIKTAAARPSFFFKLKKKRIALKDNNESDFLKSLKKDNMRQKENISLQKTKKHIFDRKANKIATVYLKQNFIIKKEKNHKNKSESKNRFSEIRRRPASTFTTTLKRSIFKNLDTSKFVFYPPKRLSSNAAHKFYKSFNMPSLRSGSYQSILRKKKKSRKKNLSLNISKNAPSNSGHTSIISEKANYKCPFTPKFSFLRTMTDSKKINMKEVCKLWNTPFVSKIESIQTLFKNVQNIGKGTYAMVYSEVKKDSEQKLIIKTLKMKYFNKLSKLKRLMVGRSTFLTKD